MAEIDSTKQQWCCNPHAIANTHTQIDRKAYIHLYYVAFCCTLLWATFIMAMSHFSCKNKFCSLCCMLVQDTKCNILIYRHQRLRLQSMLILLYPGLNITTHMWSLHHRLSLSLILIDRLTDRSMCTFIWWLAIFRRHDSAHLLHKNDYYRTSPGARICVRCHDKRDVHIRYTILYQYLVWSI